MKMRIIILRNAQTVTAIVSRQGWATLVPVTNNFGIIAGQHPKLGAYIRLV